MRTRYELAAILMMCAAATLTSVVFAQQASGGVGEPQPGIEAAPLEERSGRVHAIDFQRQLLTLATGEGIAHVRVNDQTTIFLKGRTGSISELAPGHLVKATYEVHRGLPLAAWIELVTSSVESSAGP